jgi:hypothetical protein
MTAVLTNYFKAIAAVDRQGDAREESFYSCLEALLLQVAAAAGKSDVRITTLPKATEAGNPDFRVWNGQDRIVDCIAPPSSRDRCMSLCRITPKRRMP